MYDVLLKTLNAKQKRKKHKTWLPLRAFFGGEDPVEVLGGVFCWTEPDEEGNWSWKNMLLKSCGFGSDAFHTDDARLSLPPAACRAGSLKVVTFSFRASPTLHQMSSRWCSDEPLGAVCSRAWTAPYLSFKNFMIKFEHPVADSSPVRLISTGIQSLTAHLHVCVKMHQVLPVGGDYWFLSAGVGEIPPSFSQVWYSTHHVSTVQ